MLTLANDVMHGTLCFAIENVAEPLVFVKKMPVEHVFSVQNTWIRRPFQSETEDADALNLSRTSQRHDFANPLGVEALSL